MNTPLIILGILLIPLMTATALSRHVKWLDSRVGGIVGLAAAFVFFGLGHFVQTEPMAAMLPPWVPYRVWIIYATGLVEWMLAIALIVPRTRRCAGWVAIMILVGFFPANIYAAINSTGMGGHQWGPMYLWIRAPLQLILIGWTYFFSIGRFRPMPEHEE